MMEGAIENEQFSCHLCFKMFKTADSRNGHLASHKSRKRNGASQNFTRQKYFKDPKKKSDVSKKPIQLGRCSRGTRRLPPSSVPYYIVVPRPIRIDEPNKHSGLEPSLSIESSEEVDWFEEDDTASMASFITATKPTLSPNELRDIMKTLCEWVKSEDSPYNKELLKWFSKLPLRTPNRYAADHYIEFFKNIEKNLAVKYAVTDYYLKMLELAYDGIYYLPAEFAEIGDDFGDADQIAQEVDDDPEHKLKMLLVNMNIQVAKGECHSYLGVVDFEKQTITYYDTGAGLTKLFTEDRIKMKKVMKIAKKLKPGKYEQILITDAEEAGKESWDCAFYTCLFAKTAVLERDYHVMGLPCRKTIIYEILKAKLVE